MFTSELILFSLVRVYRLRFSSCSYLCWWSSNLKLGT